MTLVTRTLQADAPATLQAICEAMGYVRADIWRRYGGLGVGDVPFTNNQGENDLRQT